MNARPGGPGCNCIPGPFYVPSRGLDKIIVLRYSVSPSFDGLSEESMRKKNGPDNERTAEMPAVTIEELTRLSSLPPKGHAAPVTAVPKAPTLPRNDPPEAA